MGRQQEAQLGTPVRGKEASTRPPIGRVCTQDGCATVLSTYNSSSLCWLHAPILYKPTRKDPA